MGAGFSVRRSVGLVPVSELPKGFLDEGADASDGGGGGGNIDSFCHSCVPIPKQFLPGEEKEESEESWAWKTSFLESSSTSTQLRVSSVSSHKLSQTCRAVMFSRVLFSSISITLVVISVPCV